MTGGLRVDLSSCFGLAKRSKTSYLDSWEIPEQEGKEIKVSAGVMAKQREKNKAIRRDRQAEEKDTVSTEKQKTAVFER
ncbi:hypothetical protein KUDE01_010201 [Dissostichus eleginoides]|uniref:Uncharacterized protein n=1 Tax=Dissostichus eleginoides TaxID=100907 RepID=A0AAD9BYH7_DISEL|nr:hypothetical protein KUDE01_010201 [Dissostichus eleginoides]